MHWSYSWNYSWKGVIWFVNEIRQNAFAMSRYSAFNLLLRQFEDHSGYSRTEKSLLLKIMAIFQIMLKLGLPASHGRTATFRSSSFVCVCNWLWGLSILQEYEGLPSNSRNSLNAGKSKACKWKMEFSTSIPLSQIANLPFRLRKPGLRPT